MRLALYSDLHLEHANWNPPRLDVDVVILAGDIDRHTRGIEWAAKAFNQNAEILYVAGNHEYYTAQLELLAEMQDPFWEQLGVHILEKRRLELSGVRFLGCTLWSGFDLYGSDAVDAYMAAAKRTINDYRVIFARKGKRLQPHDTLRLYRTAVRWLESELAKPFEGATVVVTHFAPHRRCVAPEHENSDLSPYFVSDLSHVMQKHSIDLWCFGHTHTNCDFIAENGCRVISNQRGYPSEPARGFRSDLIIDLALPLEFDGKGTTR